MQGGLQCAFLVICMAMGLVGGILTGFIARLSLFDTEPYTEPPNPPKTKVWYSDDDWWSTPGLETPWYHDAKKDDVRLPVFEEQAKELPRPEVVIQTQQAVSDTKLAEVMQKIDKVMELWQRQQSLLNDRSRVTPTVSRAAPMPPLGASSVPMAPMSQMGIGEQQQLPQPPPTQFLEHDTPGGPYGNLPPFPQMPPPQPSFIPPSAPQATPSFIPPAAMPQQVPQELAPMQGQTMLF
mmetsp:Transcript_35091/g.75915  ORF Transcript_35091/g.75915 Transcript_35091/m.75915 type:complete len:237 (-) Transcript_35091:92-802(-)